ncbi:MAG: Gfo/Idh/MocA family oxidoreductase [Bifidobacteriaceae bacterium]|nr:Gfo/Idh/MocA family oxidoreductase [Bifidobacteriaceae bacterium]
MAKKINVGVVGTSWIVDQFTRGAFLNGDYVLTGVAGSSKEKAVAFFDKLKDEGECADNPTLGVFDDLVNDERIDTVYIGTPNTLHFAQTMACLEKGKNVIVEKPCFAKLEQFDAAVKKAKEKGVYLFEAIRSLYDENFTVVENRVKQMKELTGAELLFCAYSSKYNRFLQGEKIPAFSLDSEGGAIQDFGPYVFYTALSWFGDPKKSQYFSRKLSSGVDGKGLIVLTYDDFDVLIRISKFEESLQDSEIYGDGHTIVVHTISLLNSVKDFDNTKPKSMSFHAEDTEPENTQLAQPRTNENPLQDEINFFAREILGTTNHKIHCTKSYDEITALSRKVVALSEKLRGEAGIVFPS